jgi:hypothetical protein
MKKITLFYLLIFTSSLCFAQPANDLPTGATPLTVGVDFAENAIVATNVGATASELADPTIPDPACSSYGGGDVWFTVTVPASGNVFVETDLDGSSTLDDTGMQAYEGTPGALTLLPAGCNDDGGTGFFSKLNFIGLNSGDVLYIRVFEFGGNLFDTFQISAYDIPLQSNDTCLTAELIDCGDTVTGDTSAFNLTNTVGSSSNDVWYVYSGDAGDITASLCASDYDTLIRVFDACGGTEIATNDDSCGNRSELTFTADGTSSYYIAVEGWTTTEGAFTLSISCSVTIPPPANDECINAIPLAIGSQTSGTTAGATESLADEKPGCDPFGFIADVWYSVTLPSGADNLTINTVTTGSSSEANVAIYPDGCGVLDADIIDCSDATPGGESVTSTGLTGGATYLVRVWSDGVLPPPTTGRIEGTFDITADATLSINSFENENAFTYFPNPVKNELTIKAQNNIQNVSVFNMLGQEVLRAVPNTLESNLDMNGLSQGAYFVQVTINNVTETVRILKQ